VKLEKADLVLSQTLFSGTLKNFSSKTALNTVRAIDLRQSY
jgi:hypothetical protein